MQIGELWVKISGRDEALKATLSGVEGKLQGVGKNLSSLGSDLTKKITLPVVGATAAVGGLVASFGWGRLKAMDAAEAQLKGLGYAVEDVARISEQVKNAVQGTTMTMAEGTSVAAGALAAGVKEGAELEKYIKQVGNAAVGANRPIADMAQIFNRIQGSGRLMTQELNMIEDGMPGFAMAMSDALGVTQAEFRKMVTEGKVSSEQFLDVMDSFAGEMSEAYANSWAGMVSNTKAWIGIIGESILGGVFEQSKESISEFIELLKSDDVQEWAAQTGKVIGEAFTNIIEKVGEAIEWWTNLDSSTQELIGKLTLLAVVAGPVLTITGKLIGLSTSLYQGLVLMKEAYNLLSIAKIRDAAETAALHALYIQDAVLKAAGTVKIIAMTAAQTAWNVAATAGTAATTALGTAFTFLTGPIGLIIVAIAALVAAGVLLYKNWDTIKEKAAELGEYVSGVWEGIKAKTTEIWESIKKFLVDWWPYLLGALLGPIGLVVAAIYDNWDAIKQSTTDIWTTIKDWLYELWEKIKSQVTKAWDSIYKALTNVWDMIKTGFNDLVDSAKNWGRNLIQNLIDGIRDRFEDLRGIVDNMASMVSDYLGFSSPTKLGPGRYADKWAPNLVNMFADGIRKSMPRLQVSLADMAAVMPAALGPAITNNSVSNNYGNNTFHITVGGGSSREQAEGIMRELHRLGVRF
jgi:tape measure domain-containing protein